MAQSVANLIPKIFAQGIVALRQNAILPRLVNSYSDGLAGKKGKTVDVPVTTVAVVSDVTPSATGTPTTELNPTTVPVVLDTWKESSYALDDNEAKQIIDGHTSKQLVEHVKALCNKVDQDLWSLYKDIYGYTGTAGTTPFGQTDFLDITDATNVVTVLNDQVAPLSPRHIVLNAAAYGKALTRRPLQDASWSGDFQAIMKGRLNERLGLNWWMDQNARTHTTGTLSDGTNHAALVNGALTAGTKTMNIDSTTLTGTVVTGDIFTFAGHTQTYVVTNASTLTASGNAITGVTFEPALVINVADNTAVTFKATHVANLAFHPEAFAFASRPLGAPMSSNAEFMSEVDPISGVALTVELVRQNYRDLVKFSVLYGVKTVRRELAARLAG